MKMSSVIWVAAAVFVAVLLAIDLSKSPRESRIIGPFIEAKENRERQARYERWAEGSEKEQIEILKSLEEIGVLELKVLTDKSYSVLSDTQQQLESEGWETGFGRVKRDGVYSQIMTREIVKPDAYVSKPLPSEGPIRRTLSGKDPIKLAHDMDQMLMDGWRIEKEAEIREDIYGNIILTYYLIKDTRRP